MLVTAHCNAFGMLWKRPAVVQVRAVAVTGALKNRSVGDMNWSVSSSLDGSASVVSSAVASASASDSEEPCYDEESFDDYSDAFESDGESNDQAEASADPAEASSASAKNSSKETARWGVGDRVQVFWEEENEWFDGVVCGVDGSRCDVRYDDGEQGWEEAAGIRPRPTGIEGVVQVDQLQQLLPLNESSAQAMVGCKAMVYWSDEGQWFGGNISAAKAAPATVKVEYDDGDSRWEQESTFRNVLLVERTNDQRLPPSRPEVVAPPPPAPSICRQALLPAPVIVTKPSDRVLCARPYQPAVTDHFQPVRIARPYKCVAEHHESSIITPRIYNERKDLHTRLESTTTRSVQSFTADSVTQTTLPHSDLFI